MNNLIVIRTLPFLFLMFFCQLSLKAQTNTQKDTTKVILVVVPGQSTNKPVTNTSHNAPSTSERAGTSTYANPNAAAPVRNNSAGNSAPTTAERTGVPLYMNPNLQQRNRNLSSNPGATQTTGAGGSSSSTTTTTTTTTTKTPGQKDLVTVKKNIVTTKHDTVFVKKTDTIYIPPPKTNSNKILFGELGGPGLSLSLNYDARFTSERNGFGFRIGAGYYGNGGNTVFSIPFQVNYLIGDGDHFIELGGGTTFLNSTGDNTGKTFIFDRVTGLIGTATIGYRYEPIDHKLNFRLDFVPIFYDEGIIWAGGLSIGYNF